MTKEQILAEIAAKIDGQGSAIDAGSALPGILRGILDIIPAEQVNSDWNATEGPAEILNKPSGIEYMGIEWNGETITRVRKETFSGLLGIDEAGVDKIFNAPVGTLALNRVSPTEGHLLLSLLKTASYWKNSKNCMIFGAGDDSGAMVKMEYDPVDFVYSAVFYQA